MADPRPLLYTDFDGNALDTPAPLVGRGLVDERHLDRVPGLAAVIDDPTVDPSDRLYACLALTAWGEERGYRAVVAAAGAAPPPWRGLPRAPFGLVAAQVGISDAMAEREDFGDQLGAAIFTGPPSAVAHDVVAATRRGLQRLDRRPWPSFDLPCQLVDILEPLVQVDEPTALALVDEIVRRDHSPRTLGYVAFLVATGATPAADALAAHIVAVGGPVIAERLAAARLR
jgi:hypothetical protein